MSQPQFNVNLDITFTRPSRWLWNVSLAGRHVGTVSGESSCGFIAKDLKDNCIGHGYGSAEAAMQSLSDSARVGAP